MFLRYYTTLSAPAERIEAIVLDDPGTWMTQDMIEAERSVEDLLGSVGRDGDRSGLPRCTDLVVGHSIKVGLTTIVPISWLATGVDGPYVALDADLEVAPLGTGAAHLGISARFAPTADGAAEAVDVRLIQRSVEFMLKTFLDRVAARIEVLTLV